MTFRVAVIYFRCVRRKKFSVGHAVDLETNLACNVLSVSIL